MTPALFFVQSQLQLHLWWETLFWWLFFLVVCWLFFCLHFHSLQLLWESCTTNKKRNKLDEYLFYFPKFVISLQETQTGQDRWNIMVKQPLLFPETLQRFQAVNGQSYCFQTELQNKILTNTWDFGKWRHKLSNIVPITASEMGCSLSHLRVWKHLLTNSMPMAMVLEDDCSVVHPLFVERFYAILHTAPPDWDILLLNYWLHQGNDSLPRKSIFPSQQFRTYECIHNQHKRSQQINTIITNKCSFGYLGVSSICVSQYLSTPLRQSIYLPTFYFAKNDWPRVDHEQHCTHEQLVVN
jgi:GR25 family glycosyltransferase involved in LPS biosynthesis